MIESAKEHSIRTRHIVNEGINEPWTCKNCPARSALYDLKVGDTCQTATTSTQPTES